MHAVTIPAGGQFFATDIKLTGPYLEDFMVLITGCNTLIGNSLITRLLKKGEKIKAIDNWKDARLPEEVEFIEGNVLDYELLTEAFQGVDILFHLMDIENPAHNGRRHMKKMNIAGTENVLKAAKEAEIKKIIFLSTGEVYGKTGDLIVEEHHAKKPVTPYGKDKLKAEALCREKVEKEGADITIFRPTLVTGPEIDDSMILIILYMAMAMGDANQLYIAGDGNTRFQLIHPDDVADAMLKSLETPSSRGAIYNLGSDDVPTQMEQVIKVREKAKLDCQIKHISPTTTKVLSFILKPLGINYLREEHIMFIISNFVLDCSRAKNDLKWQPTKNNIEIFVETIQWYEKEKL